MPLAVGFLQAGQFYGEPAWVLAERAFGLRPGKLARFVGFWMGWADIFTRAEQLVETLSTPTKTTKY